MWSLQWFISSHRWLMHLRPVFYRDACVLFADLQCHVSLISHRRDLHSHGHPYNMPTLHDVNVKNKLMMTEVEHLTWKCSSTLTHTQSFGVPL